jgi:hypothetical protein
MRTVIHRNRPAELLAGEYQAMPYRKIRSRLTIQDDLALGSLRQRQVCGKYIPADSTVNAIEDKTRSATWLLVGVSFSTIIFSLTACAPQAAVTPVPGHVYAGPNVQNFLSCALEHRNEQSVLAKPLFVIRVPDNRGQAYGFNDGYSLPFPSPWISDTGGTCPTSHNGCIAKPDVYSYEHALLNNVPGIAHHQFKVYELASAQPAQYSVLPREWFYNGTTDSRALDNMKAITMQFAGKPTVQSSTRTCVYVLQEVNGQLVYTGLHSQVAELHNPN